MLNCAGQEALQLTTGDHRIIDPAATGQCLRLPPAGPSGAEYLVVALATTAQVTTAGIGAPYRLAASADTISGATASVPETSDIATNGGSTLTPAQRFHAMLRERGRAMARLPLPERRSLAPRPVASPPVLGSQHSFQVCGEAECNSFVTVTATAAHVGPHSVIYLDNAAPAGGYTPAEIDHLGSLFDQYMYPIDTTAFGRETDIDGNGAIDVLLSPAVNHLSGNCDQTGSIVAGFFFPDDLLPGTPGSNEGEVFYGLVPDPNSNTCTVSHALAAQFIGPTFLHEFQHMINFGRHVLLPPVSAGPEDNWLDEGLSRLAEELGGREIPDSFCAPLTCGQQFPAGDLSNAFSYLDKTTLEATPLIEPGNIDGTLANNGANWLFVRWLADHFATDSVLGTGLTRALDGADSPEGTTRTGSTNVVAVTGVEFPILIGEWQMANYLTALPTFTETTGRLRYKSVDLAGIYTSAFGFYPLEPDSTAAESYDHEGMLRPGSGRHLLVIQSSSALGISITLSAPNGAALSETLMARIAVTRIR